MATKKTVFFTSASKPATLSPFKIPKPTVSSPLPVPYNRRQYIDQEAAIQDAIFSKMGDEAKYLQQNIHEIVAEKAREAGITKSDPNWVERLRNLQKLNSAIIGTRLLNTNLDMIISINRWNRRKKPRKRKRNGKKPFRKSWMPSILEPKPVPLPLLIKLWNGIYPF